MRYKYEEIFQEAKEPDVLRYGGLSSPHTHT